MIPGLNLYEAQIMREVTINCPGPGIIFAQASGYCDWESDLKDIIRLCFHPHNVAPYNWQTPDYDNLRIISDYGCTDSSDQYTIWAQLIVKKFKKLESEIETLKQKLDMFLERKSIN